MWCLEPLPQYENFFGIIVLHFVGHYLACMRLDFNVNAPLLSSHCSFSFVLGCGVSFLVGSNILLSMVGQ